VLETESKSFTISKGMIRAVELTPGRTELIVSLKCECVVYVTFGVWEEGKLYTATDVSSKPIVSCGEECVLDSLVYRDELPI